MVENKTYLRKQVGQAERTIKTPKERIKKMKYWRSMINMFNVHPELWNDQKLKEKFFSSLNKKSLEIAIKCVFESE